MIKQHSDIQRIFQAQKENRWNIAASSLKQRKTWLKSLRSEIIGHQNELKSAMQSDFGKSETEVELTELTTVVFELDHCLSHLDEWTADRNVDTPYYLQPAQSKIIIEPKGQTLILSPWNYPFLLAMAPLVSSIAAGNTVFLKPSEKTPETSNLIQKIVSKVFPENHVATVLGGAETASFLTSLSFDHIFFTGSPAVGKKVMAAAASNLASVTLELGGKSPVVVAEDCNLEKTVQTLMWGKYLNAGQTCIAPDFALVSKKLKTAFEKEIQKTLSTYQLKEMSQIIDQTAFERLEKIFRESQISSEKVISGGQFLKSERKIEVTVIEASWESPWMKEEIFGPILPIIYFEDLDKEIENLRKYPKPLAMYFFGNKDLEDTQRKTTSGSWVTDNVAVQFGNINLPFGGVGPSGHGSSHGYAGFRCFTHEKSVMKQGFWSPNSLFFPPYDNPRLNLARKMIAKLIQ